MKKLHSLTGPMDAKRVEITGFKVKKEANAKMVSKELKLQWARVE
jgi:hypothetical protein